MTAAAPPPVANRIADYLTPPPPRTPEEQQAAWADALFAAAMLYQRQLAHPDPDVAERAARAIFDLEKTRLRHGRDLAGTPAPAAPAAPPLEPIDELGRRLRSPAPGRPDSGPPPAADDGPLPERTPASAFWRLVERFRTILAADGGPEPTEAEAVEYTKAYLRDCMGHGPAADPAPPAGRTGPGRA